jgi:hypothetical protein
MLKYQPKTETPCTSTNSCMSGSDYMFNIPQHLRRKGRQIVITNVCNMNCGGCVQLIGHFPKEKLWFMSIEDIDKNIRLLKKYMEGSHECSPISIFGGEPTLHPQWDELIALLKNYKPTIFWINTNGRLGHKRYQKEENLVYWVDLHPDSQKFVRSLYAASDAIKLPDDMSYWRKAQKDCDIWKGCSTSIYKNKAYFCENAGPMDLLFYDGQYGWELDDNKHPFVKSKEEIDEQAKHFCKRCGWCVTELVPRQFSKDPSHVSPANYVDIKKGRHSLEVIQPDSSERWGSTQVHSLSVLDLTSSIGIYRIHYPGSPELSQDKLQEELFWNGVHRHDIAKPSRKQAIEESLIDGKSKYDWVIVLEANHVIPNNAMISIMDWMAKEKLKENKRAHFSMPVYDMLVESFDINMSEPSIIAKSVVIGFSKNSTEVYDDGIYGRIGHRKECEGSGRTSLWHDRLTDIVGGVVALK